MKTSTARRPDFAAAIAFAAASALLAGCKPDLGAPISLVSGPRILAVRGTPPEGKEKAMIAFDLLAVDVDGAITSPQATWAICEKPRPPSETNGVAAACLTIDDQFGPSPTFTGTITASDPDVPNSDGACNIFGPFRPRADPTARPRDPDITGGFYEPVRTKLPGTDGEEQIAFDLERIQCKLANAPDEVANTFNNPDTGYQPNKNPTFGSITVTSDGGAPAGVPLALPGAATSAVTVAPGQRITLDAAWTDDSAETFPVYDLQTVSLNQQREALRVSWFASDGVFDHDVTGLTADDPALDVTNVWKAPVETKLVRFWLVLRDNRGGVDFTEIALNVAP